MVQILSMVSNPMGRDTSGLVNMQSASTQHEAA